MLRHPTQISGIPDVLPVQHSNSGAASSLTFGDPQPSLVTLRSKPFGRALFAFAGRFATLLLAAERLQHQVKVASPTVAPRGHERSSERPRPRQIST